MNWRTAVDRLLPEPIRQTKAEIGRSLRYTIGRFKTVTENPVLVLGNQKSGTTVIAAALAHCANVSATLDLRDLTADQLVGVYEGTVSTDAFIDRYRWSSPAN